MRALRSSPQSAAIWLPHFAPFSTAPSEKPAGGPIAMFRGSEINDPDTYQVLFFAQVLKAKQEVLSVLE